MSDESDETSKLEAAGHASILNGYRSIVPDSWATGFNPESRRDRTLVPDCVNSLARQFLASTRFLPTAAESHASIEAFFTPSAYSAISIQDTRCNNPLDVFSLPSSAPMRLPISEAIRRRRSHRSFTGDKLPLDMLAAIIRAAGGITGEAHPIDHGLNGSLTIKLRSVASAGGLYPIELWLIVLNVEGLRESIYSYDVVGDQLFKRGGPQIVKSALDQFIADQNQLSFLNAAAICLFVGYIGKSLRKYGDRGLRYVFHELGAMSQNMHLAATALGVGSVDCAGFYDAAVEEILTLRRMRGNALHSVIIGITE